MPVPKDVRVIWPEHLPGTMMAAIHARYQLDGQDSFESFLKVFPITIMCVRDGHSGWTMAETMVRAVAKVRDRTSWCPHCDRQELTQNIDRVIALGKAIGVAGK